MTSRQAIVSVGGVAAFAVAVGLLFVGQSYLEKSRIRSMGSNEPELLPTVAQVPTVTSAASAEPAGTDLGALPSGTVALLREGLGLLQQKKCDAALAKVNEVIASAPQNPSGYELRGSIYAEKKLWDQAAKDYQTVIETGGKASQMKFNLAELNFMQKKYEAARPGFVALESDPDIGDLAAYKAFLCDLWGGQDAAATQELEAFNRVGTNASYYFANAASLLYQHKTEEARGRLMSAANIYAPAKFRLYAASLIGMGYLPLPEP